MPRCWIGTMLGALWCCSAAACSGADHDIRRGQRQPRAERDAEVVDAAAVDAEAIDAAEPTPSEPDAATAPEPEPREKPAEAHDAATRPTEPTRIAEPTHEIPQVSADAGTPPAKPDDDDAGMPAADGGGMFDAATTLPAHEFFSTVAVEDAASVKPAGASEGDLWASCWSNDGALYVAAGDSTGFSLSERADLVVSKIEGAPDDEAGLRGTTLSYGNTTSDVWSGPNYNRKPTGMLCVDGDLYLAVQDLRLETFSDAPAATVVRSRDKGQTWSWDRSSPMFDDHVFTTIMFLDYGRDSEHGPSDVVYVYGIDNNWCFDTTLTPPTQLFLARVPRAAIQDRSRWQFFTGYDREGRPRWSAQIAARAPVLEDTRRTYATPIMADQRFKNMTVINQGGVVYNAPLQRYIYASWTEYTFELYEAPQPWGPWTHFFTKDFGVTPWNQNRNGGYATTIPSKFISADGHTMWLQANAWPHTGADNYHFSLRTLRVTPYTPSEPNNTRSASSLSTEALGAVAIGRTFRLGAPERLNDGVTRNQSEDSWSGDLNTEDYWGYTWPRAMRFNQLRYTTGWRTSEGGWFERLTVQVRRGRAWVDVTGLTIEPSYSFDANVREYSTYVLRFDETSSDGVRLYGRPGGSGRFTSIAELSVVYQ